MEVRRRGLRSECIQPQVIELLRIQRKRRCQRLAFCQVHINLAEGVETLELHVALEWRQARYRYPEEAVFERVCEGNFVFDQRPSDGKARCSCLNPQELPGTLPCPGEPYSV